MTDHSDLLAQPVFIGGSNHPFGELTLEQVRARADELREAIGWGPTARVAPVARAWRELSLQMEKSGAATVGALEHELLAARARELWVVLPG